MTHTPRLSIPKSTYLKAGTLDFILVDQSVRTQRSIRPSLTVACRNDVTHKDMCRWMIPGILSAAMSTCTISANSAVRVPSRMGRLNPLPTDRPEIARHWLLRPLPQLKDGDLVSPSLKRIMSMTPRRSESRQTTWAAMSQALVLALSHSVRHPSLDRPKPARLRGPASLASPHMPGHQLEYNPYSLHHSKPTLGTAETISPFYPPHSIVSYTHNTASSSCSILLIVSPSPTDTVLFFGLSCSPNNHSPSSSCLHCPADNKDAFSAYALAFLLGSMSCRVACMHLSRIGIFNMPQRGTDFCSRQRVGGGFLWRVG